MNKIILIVITLVCLSTTNADAKKKLYKWVDENGNVTYSDQVPPSQITKKHVELNGQGVVVNKIGNARSKEEIQAERDARLKKLAEEKQAAKQEKIRLNIIKAYTNEEEIIRLKDERIYALARNVKQAQDSLVFQNESREQLLSRAADTERNGKKISVAIKSRIKSVENKIMYQKEFIKAKTAEIDKVKQKFVQDLAIYREAVTHKSSKKVLK